MQLRRIEEASLNAWPASQQVLFDGWVLRFSKGYTKRANSVNPLYESDMDIVEKATTCEKAYLARSLKPVFRLTPFAPPEMDQVLAERGYVLVDPTLVLYLDLKASSGQDFIHPTLQVQTLETWMETFCWLSGTALEKHQTHKEILQAIPGERYLVSLSQGSQVVSCGMGVLEGDYFGLFDIVTAPQQRRKGYGAGLVAGLLQWARERGARYAYLQVVRANEPARRLYAKFGFQEAYTYWYRILE